MPSAGSAAHGGSRHADILSRDYELEQTNLTNLVEYLRQEVKEQEKQKVNVRQFIAAVRKYTDMQQLDASVLREFVEKIYISEVYTPDENEPRIKVREIEIAVTYDKAALRTSEHRSMYSYVRLSIDRCTATYV